MNTLRVVSLALLLGAGLFFRFGLAQAQEATTPSEGVDYVAASLEISSAQVVPDQEGKNLIFTALIKNSSPDQQNYYLGVDFRATAGNARTALYTSRVPEMYTLEGNSEKRIQFTLASPTFLSGNYALSLGANDEKGSMVGRAKVTDMDFSGGESVELSECQLSGQSFDTGIRIRGNETTKGSVVCKALWNGNAPTLVSLSVRLSDFRYAAPLDFGQMKASLSKQISSVTVPFTKALPAGFYQIEVTPLDGSGQLIGAPVRTPIAVEGTGGKIVAIAETAVMQKDGKSVVPVSVLTEVYDQNPYKLMLSLTSEGKVCADPLTLSLDANATNEQAGEFTLTKECRYPVIMATLTTPEGKKIDQAVRPFGERVPVRALSSVAPAVAEMAPSSTLSMMLIAVFSLPVLFLILYFVRKRLRMNKAMMSVFFVLVLSALFSSGTGQAKAAYAGFYLNYNCINRPCPEATTIWTDYTVKDTFAPGEDIIVEESIGSDDWPIAPTGGIADFRVNSGAWTGDLDTDTYTAQQLRMGVFKNYTHSLLKAPTTPGDFTLTISTGMGGYKVVAPKTLNLKVVKTNECAAPGWGPSEAVYDGWAGSAPKWCREYSGGRCTADEGGNSPSTTGNIVSCCDMEDSVDNVGYVRYCQAAKGGAKVTMTGKPGDKMGYEDHSFWGKMLGLWKEVVSPASASGPAVNIAPNQQVLLTWSSQSVRSCTLSRSDGGRDEDVSVAYTNWPVYGITANSTLTISCVPSGGGSNVTDTVNVVVNGAPAAPTITGPGTGVTNTPYTYTMTSTDPEGNTLRYGVDRDNNNTVDAFYPSTGYVNSGTGQNVQFTWSTPGTYTFQAMAQDNSGASSNFTAKTVTITNAVPAALNVCPTSATIYEGDVADLNAWYTASGTNFNGCAAPNGTRVDTSATWGSSNSGVASVSNGNVTGITPGTATIQATYSSLSDTSAVTVLCKAKDSCSSQTSQDKAKLVCTTDTFDVPDGCGVTLKCNGSRTCDYNWKEVAP